MVLQVFELIDSKDHLLWNLSAELILPNLRLFAFSPCGGEIIPTN